MAKLRSLEEIEPIKHLGARVIIPLSYCTDGEFPWPVGSGTLLHAGERLFVLTAAHNFDDCDINKFWLPSDRVGGRPRAIGAATLWRPADREQFDIAVIELLDAETRDAVRLGWSSVPITQISEPSAEGTFFLFGYPSEKLHRVDKTLMCSMITACSQRLAAPPDNAKSPIDVDVDLFFLYDDVATDEDGDEVVSPHLRGTSGGGIWEILEPTLDGLWTAEKNMRLIGVQSSAMSGEWFRGIAATCALEPMKSHQRGAI